MIALAVAFGFWTGWVLGVSAHATMELYDAAAVAVAWALVSWCMLVGYRGV